MSSDDSASRNSPHTAPDGSSVNHDGTYLQPPHIHPLPAVHVPKPLASATSQGWNTDSLGLRLAVDVGSAAASAALICPIITVLDRAIIEKAAKGMSIRHSLQSSLKGLITRPHHFFISTPFLLIYTLYSSTYITANVMDTIVSTTENKSFDNVSAGLGKFLSTAFVNMSICVYKDSRFAKLFGAQSAPAQKPQSAPPKGIPQTSPKATCHPSKATQSVATPKIPKTSFALFCGRDSMTIFASFNLPPLVSPLIPDFLASTPSSKAALAQFSIPASIQLLSTPLHLLGLDLYNRQPKGGLPAGDRFARVKRDWFPSSMARIGRILPAYGVGGVVNTRLRHRLMGGLGERSTTSLGKEAL